MNPESNRPVVIEDLLRLKRAERPPAEFWSTFDRELRAKQLSALVGKRPWWQRLPRMGFKVWRYRVPLGASAVLALTFFTVRDYQATAPNQPVTDASRLVASESAPDVALATVEVVAAKVETATPTALTTVAQPEAASIATISAVPAVANLDATPFIAEAPSAAAHETQSPAARHIAANLASIQTADTIPARRLLDVASGFEERVMPIRMAVEPLQQMTPPGDSRRSRILTAMVSSASWEASIRTTARAASRIEEERLYDQIQRFGARGDRVQVKF